MNKMRINNRLKRTFVGLAEDAIPIEFCTLDNNEIGLLIIPPDPNWNGSMDTPLIDSIFRACDKNGIAAARFSFLKYQIFNNIYERYIIQTSVCLEEMLKEIEGIKYLWVCGYSFGALLALQMVLRRTEICGFILISPPLLNYDFVSWLTTCKAKGLVIFGTKDDILPEQAVEAYIQCLKKKMDVKLLPIVGVNHYFTGKIRIVTNEVINFIKRSTLKMKEDENKQILK